MFCPIFRHSRNLFRFKYRSSNSTTFRGLSNESKGAKVSSAGTTGRVDETSASGEEPGFFSRNPGLLLGGIITSIGCYLYRQHENKKRFEIIQNRIAEEAVISPFEAYEVRSSNEITPREFRNIVSSLSASFPSGFATYQEFDQYLAVKLRGVCPKGIVNGYHLERVLLSIPKNEKGESDVHGLMIAFSVAIKGSPEKRLECLYELMQKNPKEESLRNDELDTLLGYLLKTYQIPSEKRVKRVSDETQYPFEEYEEVSNYQLRAMAIKEYKKNHVDHPNDECGWNKEDFTELLKGKTICVWGECYLKTSKKRLKN